MALDDSQYPNYESISGTLYIGTTGVVSPAIKLSDRDNSQTIFNSGKLNTDFRILPTGSKAGLFFDASTSRLGINTTSPDSALHITDFCLEGGLKIENSADCDEGAFLHIVGMPSTGPEVGSYPAVINLTGGDTNQSEVVYSQIKTKILDNRSPSNGTHFTSGELSFHVDNTGVLVPVFIGSIQRTNVGLNNTTSNSLYETIVGSLNNLSNSSGAVLIGNSGVLTSLNSGIIIGSLNNVSGNSNLGLVNSSQISGISNLIHGNIVLVSGSNNIAIGNNTNTSGNFNISFGNNIQDIGNSGLIVGYNNNTSGNMNNLIGINNNLSGDYSNIYGNNNVAKNVSGIISIGANQSLSGISGGIFIGNNISGENLNNSLIVGLSNNYTSLPESILFGSDNNLINLSDHLILYGQDNTINGGSGSIIIGELNRISGLYYNLCIGKDNRTLSDTSNNNIIVGSFVNSTGSFVYTTGYVDTFSAHADGNINHNILVGINNISLSSNNNNVLGHKNLTSGNNITTFGSFNRAISSNNSVVGNSNIAIGNSNVVLGYENNSFGNDTINIGSMNYAIGNNSINLGHNQSIVSGQVVGSDNQIANSHNIIYGSDNQIGDFLIYSFFYNSANNLIFIHYDSEEFKVGDTAQIFIVNQDKVVSASTFDVTNRAYNDQLPGHTQLAGYTPTSETLFHSASSFNDDTTPTNISGYITKIKDGASGQEYGKTNIVIGRDNTIAYSTGIYIGQDIISSGNNIVCIGNDILIDEGNDNLVVIQSVEANRFVSDENNFHINPNRAQSGVIIYSQTEGINDTATFDMTNNRVGINRDVPQYTLDVNGAIAATNIVLSQGATDGYVLTSDANGSGSWTLPTRAIAGDSNSTVAVLLENNVVSGVDALYFNAANTGLNLYSSTVLFSPTGQFFVDTPVNMSYGLTELSVTDTEVSINTLTVEDQLNVNNNIYFDPATYSSGILRVNSQGNLEVSEFDENLLMFTDSDGYLNGSNNLKYVAESGLYVNEDNGASIVTRLSTADGVSTIINQGLNNSDVSIYANDGIGGSTSVHYSRSGVLSINAEPQELVDNQVLVVGGKTWTSSLRVGTASSTTSGFYLRAKDENGNVEFAPLNLPVEGSRVYPIAINAVDGFNKFQVSFDKNKSWNSVEELKGGNREDSGAMFVYKGLNGGVENERWAVSNNLRARQSSCGSNLCINGLEIGQRSSLLQHNGGVVYSAGSFDNLATNTYYNKNNAAAQYALYHLRTSTSGVQNRELTSNFPTTSISKYNTISFNDSVLEEGYNELVDIDNHRQYIWEYRISINAIWQSGNDPSTIDGGSFVYEGAIKCRKGSSGSSTTYSFTKLGQETVKSYLPPVRPVISGIVSPIVDNDSCRLAVIGSGGSADYRIKWSSISQINQINMRLDNFNY
jgi:hypothetical protein